MEITMRPYILGLFNPQGNPPLDATIPGTAGYRLWTMATEACGIPLGVWEKSIQRVNLIPNGTPKEDHVRMAQVKGRYLAPMIRERTVILLGNDVARAVGHTAPAFEWEGSWILIPHPSGLTRAYNDPVVRAATSVLLADVLFMTGAYTPEMELVDA